MPRLLEAFFLQVPDGSVVALVSKQVTAYNAVNNSTVSRTSASKYGEFSESSWGREDARACRGDGHNSSTAERLWRPGWEVDKLTITGGSLSREESPHSRILMQERDLHP